MLCHPFRVDYEIPDPHHRQLSGTTDEDRLSWIDNTTNFRNVVVVVVVFDAAAASKFVAPLRSNLRALNWNAARRWR